MSLEPLLQQVVPLMLVVFRMAGLFVFTPILSSTSLPRQLKAILALTLGVAVYVGLPADVHRVPDLSTAEVLPLIVSETLIGVVIGFLASIPILAMNMAGFLMGHEMGLSLAGTYNPEIGADSDALGQILMYVGLATYLALGGLEAAYLSLVSTFQRVPIGAFAIDRPPLEAITGVVSSGFELAMRIAAPVMAIIFLLLIAMGFVMKTMPQVNVLTVGFTIKILFGLAMLAVSLAAMQGAAADGIEHALHVAVEWVRGLS
jgi:flagellar biosynthesis protein FliR